MNQRIGRLGRAGVCLLLVLWPAGCGQGSGNPAPAASGSGGASGAGVPSGTGGGVAGGGGGTPVPASDAGRAADRSSEAGAVPAPDAASAAVDAPASPAGACQPDRQRMFADVMHLASPALRGRKPGDPGNELALQYAEGKFRAAGLAPAGDQGTFRQAFPFAGGRTTDNVLGVLAGTDSAMGAEVIVVGAHIDHLGVNQDGRINHGADDNASGAAVVMELARLFKDCGVRPRRTVLFAQWNAEEMGLVGSRHYVQHPVFPLERTIAAYNFDMVGAGDSSGVLLFGGSDPRNAWLTELMRGAASAAGLRHVIQIVPQKLASDHAPFVQRGIPICWGFARPDPHPGYHTPDDDIDNIRPASLEVVAQLFWAALRPLALGEEDRFTTRPALVPISAPQGRLPDGAALTGCLPVVAP